MSCPLAAAQPQQYGASDGPPWSRDLIAQTDLMTAIKSVLKTASGSSSGSAAGSADLIAFFKGATARDPAWSITSSDTDNELLCLFSGTIEFLGNNDNLILKN
jgi:hypothetical protein